MLQLIYRSEAAEGTDLYAAEEIVACAGRKNRNLEMTGLLLFTGMHFVQVLEGGQHVVMRVFEQIKEDPRHRNVELLLCRPIQKRYFPYASMQLIASDSRRLPAAISPGASAQKRGTSSGAICSAIAKEFSRARNTSLMGYEDRHAKYL